MSLLEAEALAVSYGEMQAVWSASLSLQPSSIVALIGSNGAGKSTLLRALSGLMPIKSGSIRFAGNAVEKQGAVERVNAGLVLVPEGRRLFAGLTVMENLLLGAYKRRDGRVAIKRDLEWLFDLFPRLAERRWQDATLMSGGEQQMCAIARGLMAGPKLIMVDELSLGLAPRIVDELVVSLRAVRDKGVAVLVVEQDVATALDLAEHVYVLDQGRIVKNGSAIEMSKDPAIQVAYLGT